MEKTAKTTYHFWISKRFMIFVLLQHDFIKKCYERSCTHLRSTIIVSGRRHLKTRTVYVQTLVGGVSLWHMCLQRTASSAYLEKLSSNSDDLKRQKQTCSVELIVKLARHFHFTKLATVTMHWANIRTA